MLLWSMRGVPAVRDNQSNTIAVISLVISVLCACACLYMWNTVRSSASYADRASVKADAASERLQTYLNKIEGLQTP